MTAILPTSALARLAGLSTGVGSGVVEQAPPEVARLASGAIVDGTVVGRDRAGLTLIQTEHGMIRLQTGAKLPEGAAVKLELQINGNQIRAVILTVEQAAAGNRGAAEAIQNPVRTPPPVSLSPGPGPATLAPARQDILPGGNGPLLSAGSVVAARLIPVADSQATPGTVAAGTPQQTGAGQAIPGPHTSPTGPTTGPDRALMVRILYVAPPVRGGGLGASSLPVGGSVVISPAPAGQGAPPLSHPTPSVSGAPPAASGVTAGAAAPAATTHVGRGPARPSPLPSALSAQAVASEPGPTAGHPGARPMGATGVERPAPPPAGPAGAPPEHLATRAPSAEAVKGTASLPTGSYSGTVVGQNGAGGVILATPLGRMLVLTGSTLPPGTSIHFQVTDGADQLISGGINRAIGRTGMGLAQEWPTLQQLVGSIATADAQSALLFAGGQIPQPGPRLAHGILFFMTAMGLGDVGRWLGAGLQAELRTRGQAELFGRLSDDFQQLGRMVSDGAQGDWRTYLVPIWDGEGLRQFRFFHRRHDGDQDGEGGPGGDRFLIDLDLSKLGAVQIDGLLQTNRFNLIVRSQSSLDQRAREEIEEIFREGCGCAGLTGDIAFAGAEDFVPLPFSTPNSGAATVTV